MQFEQADNDEQVIHRERAEDAGKLDFEPGGDDCRNQIEGELEQILLREIPRDGPRHDDI